jgi:hypothetical protein
MQMFVYINKWQQSSMTVSEQSVLYHMDSQHCEATAINECTAEPMCRAAQARVIVFNLTVQ